MLLTLGSAAHPYSFLHGIIDAGANTGGVETWLSLGEVGPVTNPTPLDTFIGGTGNDTVHLLPSAFAGNLIDFSKGGSDTVEFSEARYSGAGLLTNNPPTSTELYNSVVGFTTPNDAIDIHNSGVLGLFGAVNFTNGTGAVPAGAATTVLDMTTGANVIATGTAFDYIKIDTPTSGAGQTAQQGFASALGTLGRSPLPVATSISRRTTI